MVKSIKDILRCLGIQRSTYHQETITGEKLTLPEECRGDRVKDKQKRAGKRVKDV